MAEETKAAGLSVPETTPMGIGYKRELEYPCPEDSFKSVEEIIRGLRDMSGEHLVIELQGFPDQMDFIQTVKTDDD